MARRLIVPIDTQRAPVDRKPAGVFFCQDVPRTDRKISTTQQFSRAADAICSHEQRGSPKAAPVRASMALDRQYNVAATVRQAIFLRETEPRAARSERSVAGSKIRPAGG